jgi:benzoate membrane transport protein
MGGLHTAMTDDQDREAALVTFLVTASGLTIAGIGSAFWGLLFGVVIHLILTTRRKP